MVGREDLFLGKPWLFASSIVLYISPKVSEGDSSYKRSTFKPNGELNILNTYTQHTQEQIDNALETLEVVFEDDPKYKDLSKLAKELFAGALLTAHELTRKD